ncbi:hypothetical protein [Streptantibioticus ferralitis]|uniref:Uncharacterized protein n=1 Tax=Streptantibioticus ferralitis TaxID=236510 RepID=A0ABT5ZB41_9ACTN|nr:hypothetical protein [Streptantibioticus ferralitis]MDF2260938.1 hypothetical protein [Streptantibioticus ferralitis]
MRDLLGQAWRWPLYSAKRLLVSTIAVIAVLIAVSAINHSGTGHRHAAPAGSSPTSAPASTSPDTSASPSSTATNYSQAIDTARAFVTAWASHPAQKDEWLAGVTRYATTDFANSLGSVDPSNVHATKITGTLKLTDTGSSDQTSVAVPTDGGTVSVTLTADGTGGWQVSDLRPGAQAAE